MIGAHRLVARALGTAGTQVWLALVGLFTTPYILNGLGDAAYGVFAMVLVVSAHLSNLQLGFGHAVVHYLARARAVSDVEGERKVLDTSAIVFSVTGVTAGALLYFAADILVHSFFNVAPELRAPARNAFRLGAVILTSSFLSSFFSAALQAFGRFRPLNSLRVLFGTISSAAAVGAVAAGTGLQGVFILQAIVASMLCTCMGREVYKKRPFRPRATRATLRVMGAYGGLTFIAGVSYQWMINGLPLVLAAHVPSGEIPAFSIPHTILQKLLLLVASVSLAFFPVASSASVGRDRAPLADIYRSHLRLTILVMGPITAYLGVFAEELLGAWIGPAFGASAGNCQRLIAAAAFVLALAGPSADITRGLGRPSWILVYTTAVALLGLLGGLALVPGLGPDGAALALLASVVLGSLPFIVLVSWRLLGVRPRELSIALLGPFLVASVLTAAFGAIHWWRPTLTTALLGGGTLTLLYSCVVLGWVLDPRERKVLQRVAGVQ